VVSPARVGYAEVSDAKHLIYAIGHIVIHLKQDYKDFIGLHDLICIAGDSHHGILLLYKKNDPMRNLIPRNIAMAITQLEDVRSPLRNQIYIVNH